MKSKLFIIFMLMFFNQSVVSSDNSDNSESEVATQTDEIQEDYFELPEVSVNSSLSTQLHQLFTHDSQAYKNIEFGEFYKHYFDQIAGFVAQAESESKLTMQEQRDVQPLQIVGERPLWHDEFLFDCKKARDVMIELVQEFIDEREDEVREKCIGHVLQERRSKVVWAPDCCGIQLHKHCFRECKKSDVNRCLNSFCPNPAWSAAFYARVARERKTVHSEDIFDVNCPVCFDPLKVANAAHASKHQLDEKSIASNESNTVKHQGKKKRFK